MSRSLGAFACTLASMIVAFSGCMGPDGTGQSFGALAAPEWKPGFSWTYSVNGESLIPDDEPAFEEIDEEMVIRVINDDFDLKGEPVYLARVSGGEAEHPMFMGDVQAFSKKTLEIAAYAWGSAVLREEDCVQRIILDRIAPKERFPALRFPMKDGDEYRGTMPDMPFRWQALVGGLEPIETPAGTFDAAKVTITIEPGDLPRGASHEDAEEFRNLELDLSITYWYSPEVQSFLREDVRASFSSGSGRGSMRFSYRATMILESFDLTPGKAEKVPVLVRDPQVTRQPTPMLGIVSEGPMEFNVADGPVTVRFSLGDDMYPPYHEARTMDRLPAKSPLHPDEYRVSWVVARGSQGVVKEVRGEDLTYTFEEGGLYDVSARFAPVYCDLPRVDVAPVMVNAYYQNVFDVQTEDGLGTVVAVGKFPVGPDAVDGVVTIQRMPTPADAGTLHLYDDDGMEIGRGQGQGGTILFSGEGAPGTWTLEWDTGLVTLDDDAKVEVRLQYGRPQGPHMH